MSAQTRLDLATAVGRLVAGSVTDIGDVHRQPLDYDAFLAGRSVVRIRGSATADGQTIEWSLIEKHTAGPSVASGYLYDNALREFTAYRSGLLVDLAPGVRAPDVLATERGADGELTLWIEDVAAHARDRLTPDEILRAARHLGRLAGRWLARVPAHRWLFSGWIERHMQPHAMAEGLGVVRDARANSEISSRFGGRLDEAVRLIETQNDVRSSLLALPTTLCHHDAVAANVFPSNRDNPAETVLIDWESVGPGPVGADLASLLFSSVRRGDIAARVLTEVAPGAPAAYLQGLRDSGASVEPIDVALGLHASIALRWTLIRDVIRVLDGTNVARRGSAPHETPDESLDELLALVPVLLDAASEARRLSLHR
jgi:hypothetical protein